MNEFRKAEEISVDDEHFNKFVWMCARLQDVEDWECGAQFDWILEGIKKQREEETNEKGREEQKGTK